MAEELMTEGRPRPDLKAEANAILLTLASANLLTRVDGGQVIEAVRWATGRGAREVSAALAKRAEELDGGAALDMALPALAKRQPWAWVHASHEAGDIYDTVLNLVWDLQELIEIKEALDPLKERKEGCVNDNDGGR